MHTKHQYSNDGNFYTQIPYLLYKEWADDLPNNKVYAAKMI